MAIDAGRQGACAITRERVHIVSKPKYDLRGCCCLTLLHRRVKRLRDHGRISGSNDELDVGLALELFCRVGADCDIACCLDCARSERERAIAGERRTVGHSSWSGCGRRRGCSGGSGACSGGVGGSSVVLAFAVYARAREATRVLVARPLGFGLCTLAVAAVGTLTLGAAPARCSQWTLCRTKACLVVAYAIHAAVVLAAATAIDCLCTTKVVLGAI